MFPIRQCACRGRSAGQHFLCTKLAAAISVQVKLYTTCVVCRSFICHQHPTSWTGFDQSTTQGFLNLVYCPLFVRYVSRDRNIVQFYGACIQSESLVLVLELMEARLLMSEPRS